MNKFGIDSNQRWSDAHSFVEAIEQAGYYSKCLAESTSESFRAAFAALQEECKPLIGEIESFAREHQRAEEKRNYRLFKQLTSEGQHQIMRLKESLKAPK